MTVFYGDFLDSLRKVNASHPDYGWKLVDVDRSALELHLHSKGDKPYSVEFFNDLASRDFGMYIKTAEPSEDSGFARLFLPQDHLEDTVAHMKTAPNLDMPKCAKPNSVVPVINPAIIDKFHCRTM